MLPHGFYWAPRWEYDRADNGLFLDGVLVAFVDPTVDGRWRARLECQQPIDAPLVLRKCTSREAGRRGCELWAIRHEARLRMQAAAVIARRPRHCGAG